MNGMRLALVFVLLTVFSRPATACIWDAETLSEERARIPTALEIILGKFPRHTAAYYEWRLKDRRKKLKADPENDLMLDDVAVSLEKLKRYDEAISVAKQQLQRSPERYESLANLGTFYIHDGQFAEGLKYVERAIEVNPDAHFGREKYQVILVKYLMKQMTEDGLKLPVGRDGLEDRDGESSEQRTQPFRRFLRDQLHPDTNQKLSTEELEDATKGILGMMRFSRHNSPILLEALAELQQSLSADQLAFRSYLSASENSDDRQARDAYRKLASRAISWSLMSFQVGKGAKISEEDIVEDFQKEKRDADAWFQQLADDEQRWIDAGEAVDEKFNEKYRQLPAAIDTERSLEREPYNYHDPAVTAFRNSVIMILMLVIAGCGVLGWAWTRNRSRVTAAD